MSQRICKHNIWAIKHIAHSRHPTDHPDLTWDHQVPIISVIWPCRHLKYCTVTSRCHSYVVILTASLFWYHRETKYDLCHAPRDVLDLSDIPRGSAVTTHPNSDSQHCARSDLVRNRVPKEHAHPKYALLDRARLKLRFTQSRASEISFRDTSACSETARRVRTHLRAPRA